MSLIDSLLAATDAAAQRRLLERHTTDVDDTFAGALKLRADQMLRSDIQQSLQAARLLQLAATISDNPAHHAVGLLAEANVHALGLRDFQRGLACYDEAIAIYQACGDLVEQAKAQVGRLWALACLGRYDEALEAGAWASAVLETHTQWRPLTNLTSNLAIIHGRMGADAQALELFDRSRAACLRLGAEGEPTLARIDQNRAIVLRNLGRFAESIATSQAAWAMLERLGQIVETARARQNLALTYMLLGRTNEALALLDQARDIFLADGRRSDALLVDLSISDGLLLLRRFDDVLDTCFQVRELFDARGARFEVGQALLNEASAYAGLRQYDRAQAALAEAHQIFTIEENAAWAAAADLERSAVLLHQGQGAASLALATACATHFQQLGLPVREALADLVAARAAMAQGMVDRARALADTALALGQSASTPAIVYQARQILAELKRAMGDRQAALDEYGQAIQELEQLRGQLMIEFRSAFLEDKQAIYEDTVALYLELNQPRAGLEYAERAKSRALLELLAQRLDLSIHAHSRDDLPLVAELNQLRAERDRIARRWESREIAREEGPPPEEERRQARQQLLDLERRITAAWHRLLVRNAAYARDAALWQVRSEPAQPHLDEHTVLLEYFSVHGQLVAFLVTRADVQVARLPATIADIQRLVRLLRLNMTTVPASPAGRIAALAGNARTLLRDLFERLVAPLAATLAGFPDLIVVPHGPLHYLPFQALHDGRAFLLERHAISYLPGASLLRYIAPTRSTEHVRLALGYSSGGQLPHAAAEARAVAAILGGQAYVEEQATLERLRATIGACDVVHLATHGDFRPDNPLFSGLALADGWLTALEMFDLRLNASLVTLSACQTGRSLVGGGDELLGLMRALLYAGAASLLLSLWTVEDRSTAELMGHVYRRLASGRSKRAALREAQLCLLNETSAPYAHPYYWAPFFLVGDAGPLST
jgi:tetratricopeptide (TPR) repeat protein